jgi:hypothetical protein
MIDANELELKAARYKKIKKAVEKIKARKSEQFTIRRRMAEHRRDLNSDLESWELS